MDIHENNTLVLLNGNKCVPHADMIRRTLFIELQSVGERSEDRRYEGDTRDKLKTERSKVLLAIASIACAFINSREKDIRPLASHTQWDRLVRQPLLWLGFPDPIANWQTSRDHDPKRALEIELFDELAKVFGLYVDITPKDLVEKMYLPQGYDLQAIIETVMEQDKQPFSTLSVHGRAVKMGFLLGKLAGKTRNKIKMERKRGSETKPWVYVLVEEDKK